MKVLVTGGLGSLGLSAIRELARRGHDVRCFDVPTRSTRWRRRRLPGGVEVRWGDVRDPGQVREAVADRDAVVHCAAVLFPDSDRQPERAHAVNVDGTRNVLDAMAASGRQPWLVFPSSISVYGKGQREGPPRRVDDPVNPSTHYAKHKVECEEMVRSAPIPWTILRVGAAIEPGASTKLTPLALRTMFSVSLDTRIEWVHPDDVGLAMAAAIGRTEARGKVLMIGGGPACRATQRDFFAIAFEAAGIGMLPDSAFGQGGFEMDWMETTESERLLRFQRHTWEDFREGFRSGLRHHRWAVVPLRPLVRRALLALSDPWRASRAPRRDDGV
jgi:nucleoside-diphosphate-sugar epimerase